MLLRTIHTIILLALIGTIPMGCGSGSIETSSVTTRKYLVSISLVPTNPSIAKDSDIQFTATGIYSDNTTEDLTASVTWISSDPTIATIGPLSLTTSLSMYQNREQVRGRKVGNTTIQASLGSVSGFTILTVTPATLQSIAISPSSQSIAKGSSLQFIATGTYSDNSTQDITASVVWTSSSPETASISNSSGSEGLASASATGETTATATSGSISGSTTLTVTPAKLLSIDITPTNKIIGRATTQQFAATGIYSDNTTQDLTLMSTWSTSNAAIATVSDAVGSKGLAASLTAGSAVISAAFGSISGSTTLTVTPATLVSIAVMPANHSIAKGTSQQFTATATFSDNTTQDLTTSATWNSSNSGVASISNAAGSKGFASTVATGTATITATSGSVSGSTTLTVSPATLISLSVTPASQSIAKGTSQQFTAIGTYSDSSTQNLTASITWSSSATNVASISNAAGSKGFSNALATGSTTITATSGSLSASTTLTVTAATLATISVSPGSSSMITGTVKQFTATGTFSDSTVQNLTNASTWSSSNSSVASISNAAGSKGLATSISAGSIVITSIVGVISGTAMLTVTSASTSTLHWDAPTANTDGTPLTDLSGYKVYYGNAPGVYTNTVDVGSATSYAVSGLAPGTYYFAVTAYNISMNESGYSNEISRLF